MIKRAKRGIHSLLPRNAFARGVSILMGGTIGAQALTMLVAPLLTRLYSPDDYGLMAVFGSLLMVLGVNACLRYEMAIPLPEDDQEAAHIVVLCLLIAIGVSLMAAVVLLVSGPWICERLGVPALVNYLWLLPIGIFLGAGYTVFNAWSVRTKAYSAIASTRLRQALATMLIQVAAYPMGAMALLIASIAGQSIGTMRLARKALSGSQFRSVDKPGIKRVAQRYRRFPIYSSWDGLLNTAGREFPPLVFAAVFGPTATGFYALAHHVLSKPMALIGGAVGQVFFANGVEAHRQGTLGILVTNLHEKLAHIAMPPLALLTLQGPELFGLVFGAKWEQAGVYAQWMAPWMYLMCVSSPLSTVLTVLEKQKHTLLFQVMLTSFRVAAVGVGIKMGDMLTTVKLFSLASVFAYLVLLTMVVRLAGGRLRSCIRATGMALLVSAICIMPIGLALISEPFKLNMGVYPVVMVISLIAIRYGSIMKQAY